MKKRILYQEFLIIFSRKEMIRKLKKLLKDDGTGGEIKY
jgi:hypothetical protein